jgi:hypothetical protein
MKHPGSNIQAPEKLQAPSVQYSSAQDLIFGAWNFSGCWSLEFGAFIL